MREFFNGWRRKVGCVTLAMALAFMLGWGRSFVCYDWLAICSGSNIQFVVMSQGQRLGLQHYHDGSQWSPNSLDWGSGLHSGLADDLNDPRFSWRHYGFVRIGDDIWVVSYWCLALPLALLSAYLILWKPITKTGIESDMAALLHRFRRDRLATDRDATEQINSSRSDE